MNRYFLGGENEFTFRSIEVNCDFGLQVLDFSLLLFRKSSLNMN